MKVSIKKILLFYRLEIFKDLLRLISPVATDLNLTVEQVKQWQHCFVSGVQSVLASLNYTNCRPFCVWSTSLLTWPRSLSSRQAPELFPNKQQTRQGLPEMFFPLWFVTLIWVFQTSPEETVIQSYSLVISLNDKGYSRMFLRQYHSHHRPTHSLCCSYVINGTRS